MLNPLLARDVIDTDIEKYLQSVGQIFTRFDDRTQDSGNISYGVQVYDTKVFVKTAGHTDDPKPVMSHSDRVALLRNAIRLNRAVTHTAFPKLLNVIES